MVNKNMMSKGIRSGHKNAGLIKSEKVPLLLFLIIFSCSCSGGYKGDYTVMEGPFRQSVFEAGTLEAVKASYIMMPSISYQYGYQFKLIGLADHGKMVHNNDSIIKLDPASIYKYILEGEDKLENEKAAAKKQVVQSENNIQELEAQYKSEQAAYDLKKLELERSKFDTEVKKKIKELEFKQATIKLNKVKRNLELKPILENYDFRIQRIRVIQKETDLKNAKNALKQLLIKSPIDGIFQVALNIFTENPQNWKIGDSPYQGQIIASIPDLTKMKANTYINEAEMKLVRPGMKVIVRLDALPSVPFNGKITGISKICFTRDREKVFNVVVEIAESDLRLKPGMTVNCEYILYETDKGIYVPNSCLLKENGHSYVFLKKGGSFRKLEVQSGVSNSNHTLITGELNPGQKLVPFGDVFKSNKL
jgi:HlyD family secretion protein